MNNELYMKTLRDDLKRKNGGKTLITSKYHPRYPDSAEREYTRLINAYMGIEKQIILSHIDEIKKIISESSNYRADSSQKKNNEEKRKRIRYEALDYTMMRLKNLFDTIYNELLSTYSLFRLRDALEDIANLNKKLSINEWKKVIYKTIGIDLRKDYYSGDFFKEIIEKWVSENVELISTIPYNSLGKIKEIVYTNYMRGSPTTDIIKEIQKRYGIDKRHARLIARDQIGKLNSNITQKQHSDAGIKRYKWSDSRDRRVRKSHKKLNGKIFRWDNPPITENGRKCHPGEDYQCRCVALAIIDIDEIDIPI